MKYFGTDGIRGRIIIDLTDKLIDKVAKAIVLYYNKHKLKRVLLVGNDTRLSSGYILARLSCKLLKNGIDIHNLGTCSSPSLAFLTQKFNYPLGLMLSASHNPAEYNGLKFFNSFGEKVSDEFEEEFETLMDKKISLKNNCFASTKNMENLKQEYINHLKSHIKFDFPFILDCANGGTSEICKVVFPNQEKINLNPNGTNINLNAGCTHLEMLRSLCIKKQKIGFAFDGDGDRVHVVDTDGEILAGDKILFILSKFFQKSGDICVGTIYTNTGLEKALKERNISLKRSDVGDKKVYRLMRETSSILGGEDSGHIILKSHMNTGDGVLVAILIANVLQMSKQDLKELLYDYHEFCQLRENIKIENTSSATQNLLKQKTLQDLIKNFEKQNAKIIIRPSGTEPLLRLFVEHEHEKIAKSIIEELNLTVINLLKD